MSETPFQKLMKSKGLLGGKYLPVAKESIEDDKDVENEVSLTEQQVDMNSEKSKRKLVENDVDVDEEEKETVGQTPPDKKTILEAGGVISSPGLGFLRMAEYDDVDEEEEVEKKKDDPANNVKNKNEKKKKKTAAEYLARSVQSKVDNRSAKANVNSMKTKFLTGKKKFAAIQPECGVEQDFMVILKNNLQRADISHASPTAGKYMIFTRGNIREQLLGDGIKFDPSTMYMLANDCNYDEEKIDAGNGEKEEVEEGNVIEQVESQKVPKRKEEEKENQNLIYNMKAIARKVSTPGFLPSESDDEEKLEGGNVIEQVDRQKVPKRKEEENQNPIYNMKAVARKVLTPGFVLSESEED